VRAHVSESGAVAEGRLTLSAPVTIGCPLRTPQLETLFLRGFRTTLRLVSPFTADMVKGDRIGVPFR
jgi:hypothetical protein